VTGLVCGQKIVLYLAEIEKEHVQHLIMFNMKIC